jgi:hypothetical protein
MASCHASTTATAMRQLIVKMIAHSLLNHSIPHAFPLTVKGYAFAEFLGRFSKPPTTPVPILLTSTESSSKFARPPEVGSRNVPRRSGWCAPNEIRDVQSAQEESVKEPQKPQKPTRPHPEPSPRPRPGPAPSGPPERVPTRDHGEPVRKRGGDDPGPTRSGNDPGPSFGRDED